MVERVDLGVRAAFYACSHASSVDCTLEHLADSRRQQVQTMFVGHGIGYALLHLDVVVVRVRGHGHGDGDAE